MKVTEHIYTLPSLKKQVEAWKKDNQKIVFTNGCFDILHRGHVYYLERAAGLGDRLIVGVNSDASVKAQNKGPERPVVDEHSRAMLIASLRMVDASIIFEDQTPLLLIESLVPDVLVKGGDWKPENIVGREIVEANGGIVTTIKTLEGFSTTSVVKRMKK